MVRKKIQDYHSSGESLASILSPEKSNWKSIVKE